MRVTVAICTWNRAPLLERTLPQWSELVIPTGVDWELVVVNNRCTDRTDELLAEYARRLPLRRLDEPNPGRASALNCAIDAIEGDLILWTDDDVLVDRQWLAEYVRAARAWRSVAFFSGPIEPWFETPPPRWLTRAWPRISQVYGVRDLGGVEKAIDDQCLPFGANFAIRTGIQRRYRFDPKLGRIAGSMGAGEETKVARAMLRDGLQGRFIPAAKIRHFIPTSAMTPAYLRRFFFGLGETDATYDVRPRAMPDTLAWSRTRARANAILAEARFRLARLSGRPQLWAKELSKASYYWGCSAAVPKRAA
jgi:glycosyltransferase involved in cell wall biosynthesis